MLLVATSNLENNSLDTVGKLLHRDDVVLGLGDGGAHYGTICDASYSTYFLAHWARDRVCGRFTVAEAVRELTSVPARVAGLADHGRIAVGYQADLNVIDHAALRLHKPVIRLPRSRPSLGSDCRRLRRDGGLWSSNCRERCAPRCSTRTAGARTPNRPGPCLNY